MQSFIYKRVVLNLVSYSYVRIITEKFNKMVKINVRGHDINAPNIKDSYNRRATQFENTIMTALRRAGITEDYVDVKMEKFGFKKCPAAASWYVKGFHLHYSYNGCQRFVENLYVVSKIIEIETTALINEKLSFEDYVSKFSEEDNITEKRKEARTTLGLEHDEMDFNNISKTYKKLAKQHHPDMPEGDIEKFKALNAAHKILKREFV